MRYKNLILSLSLITAICLTSCGRSVSVDSDTEENLKKESNVISETEDITDDKVKNKEDEKETKDHQQQDGKYQKDSNEKNHLLAVNIGTEYTNEWSEDNQITLASLQYSMIELEDDIADGYPELVKALKAYNKEKKENMEREYENLIITAKDTLEYASDNFGEHKIEENIAVRRADSRVLSFLTEGSSFQGGVHGYYYYWGNNYDVQTGKRLELADVVTDRNALPALVQEQLDIYWREGGLYEDLDLNELFGDNGYELSWILDYNGLTIFFNPYEIAPFASGSQVVTLSFAEHPALVKKEYMEQPDTYSVELCKDSHFYYDLNDDGRLEDILISADETEYGNYEKQTIFINGHWFEEDTYGFAVEPVLIHHSDGKNYLYIENGLPNDYGQLNIYDLSSGDVEKVDVVYYAWHHEMGDAAEGIAMRQVLTNPDSFVLDSHTELLSTVTGYRNYHIGKDGIPASEQEWYDFDHYFTFTLLKSLEVAIVDEESGSKIENATLEAGSEVKYYRTDDDKFADFLLSDGRIARVQTERKEGICYIDDMYIEEILEGIIFAG